MTYNVLLLIISLAFLGVSFLPKMLKNSLLSIPIVFVGIGILVFQFPLQIDLSNPEKYNHLILRATEISVIISLMGTGLKIDKPLNYKNWKLTIIFLVISMLLGIIVTTILGIYYGFSLPIALLIASSLAPTDPVLASDVQVGPPGKGNEDNVRFTLTSEAGLNDGFAFPFVNLAILIYSSKHIEESLISWFSNDLLYKLSMGCLLGYLCGKFFGRFLYKVTNKTRAINIEEEAFIILAITFFTYSITEIIHGYGFLSVFITSILIRDSQRESQINETLHIFSDQTERMMLVTILIFFGGFISQGLFNYLTWYDLTFSSLLVFVVRPLTGFVALINSKISNFEKLCISFFGIRGLGSIYYIAYAISKEPDLPTQRIWSVICFTVLLSIIIHGISVSSVFKYLDKRNNILK